MITSHNLHAFKYGSVKCKLNFVLKTKRISLSGGLYSLPCIQNTLKLPEDAKSLLILIITVVFNKNHSVLNISGS